MRPSKKLITTLLPTFLALVGMLLVSCGTTSPSQSTGTKASADKQVLNMAFSTGISDIKTFDPALSTDAPSIQAIDLVFTGLVQLNDKLAVVPQLASSYSEGSDGLTWTFKLKPNLKFSDGTPLTSRDVVYSIDRALQPAVKSTVGPIYLALIKDSDKLVAGKIKTIIGDSLLTPDPSPKPQLTKLVYPFYKQVQTGYQAYQAGQVDYTQPVPSANISSAKSLPNNQYSLVPQLWINYYAMNYLSKPFDNIKIRQAFALAVDKDVIAHSVWKDTVIASNHIVPKGMPGYNANLTGPNGVAGTKGNQTMAKTLFQQGLQEEGYASVSQVPSIKLTYPSGSQDTDNEVAALVQMWQTTLGVSVKANPEDFNKLLTDIVAATNNPKGLQFWGIAWIADYPDPQDWTTLQFDKGVPNNNSNYGQNNTSDAAQQQQVQKQLEAADVNPDQNARIQAYNQAEQQLVNDVAWLPVEQVAVPQVLKAYVKGMVFNPQLLIPPDDWGNIYIQSH
ncbi:MAG: peptide ABC transporter substrate-binding protein [Chloroflexi bacterium]|nr:MAG: peptide ABC transporter substrate-binding protein [Chloroflexota bacterium]